MKLIKLSVAALVLTFFVACNTDRPYHVNDIYEGTPTNADTVLYNLHHESAAPHAEGHESHGTSHHTAAPDENLPRVFWR